MSDNFYAGQLTSMSIEDIERIHSEKLAILASTRFHPPPSISVFLLMSEIKVEEETEF